MSNFPATRSLRCGAAVAAFAAAALGLAACSSSSSSSAPAAAPSSAAASSPAASAAAATSAAPKKATIAYLSFAVDNSYDAPMLAAAQAVASADGASLKVFDANNSPQTQFDQMQTVIAGLSANVTFVPTTIGTQLGQQVIAACASKKLSPCKVGYLYDIKASSLDTAIYGAFTAAIKGSPVQVVTYGQSFFTPTIGLTAVETMLQATPGLDLIVGSDQGIEGAMTALTTTDKSDHVLLVGYGASAAAVAGIESGAVFSDVAQAPSAEGTDAVKALVAAIQTGKVSGAIDPVAGFPDSGVVNKADASAFTPEWQG